MAKNNSKTVLYHVNFAKPVELVLAKEYADNTADLVNAEGKLVVGKCPASKDPKHGHFTLKTEVESETETDIKTVTKTKPE